MRARVCGVLASASGREILFDFHFNSEHDFFDGAVTTENNGPTHNMAGKQQNNIPSLTTTSHFTKQPKEAPTQSRTRTRIAGPHGNGIKTTSLLAGHLQLLITRAMTFVHPIKICVCGSLYSFLLNSFHIQSYPRIQLLYLPLTCSPSPSYARMRRWNSKCKHRHWFKLYYGSSSLTIYHSLSDPLTLRVHRRMPPDAQ